MDKKNEKNEEHETEEEVMRELGITSDLVVIYKYKDHKYQKLSDAMHYAEIDRMKEKTTG